MRALLAAVGLTALSLAGCATLPNGHRWGGDVKQRLEIVDCSGAIVTS